MISVRGLLCVNPQLMGCSCEISNKYLEDILRECDAHQIPVFNVERSGILVTVKDYIFTHEPIINVSSEMFSQIRHLKDKNGFITMALFKDFEIGSHTVLKPLTTKFFDVKNQMELLTDHINTNIRILYPNQIFEIHSKELDTDITFKVMKTNNTRYKVISAYDTDLEVDFDCEQLHKRMILPEQWRDPIKIRINGDGMRCADDYILAGKLSYK